MVLKRSGSRLADMMMEGKASHPFRALEWGLCRSCLLSRTWLFKENSSRLMGSPVPGTTRGVMSKGVGREPWNSGAPFPSLLSRRRQGRRCALSRKGKHRTPRRERQAPWCTAGDGQPGEAQSVCELGDEGSQFLCMSAAGTGSWHRALSPCRSALGLSQPWHFWGAVPVPGHLPGPKGAGEGPAGTMEVGR